ncbi:MAG: DUF4131 domain-containing protein [Vicinamibacterales bacterium]
MRMVLAIPVLGLIGGAALGLRSPDLPVAWLVAALCAWGLLAIHAARVRNEVLIAVSVCGAFAVGGVLLAADAWHRAWRPTLRLVFEAIAHDERIAAVRAGRSVPDDDSAAVVLAGVLVDDAAQTAGGAVSLAIDVRWIGRLHGRADRIDPAANPVSGRALLTVAGTFAPRQMREWRAGRRVRASAEVHRPARYLDPGVADQERVLARRGVSLVGSIKSGALVTLEAEGDVLHETAASVRAFARRAIGGAVGRWSPRAAAIVERDRHWRSHRSRCRDGAAPAGVGHLSRDCDLGWEHRASVGAPCSACSGVQASSDVPPCSPLPPPSLPTEWSCRGARRSSAPC